MLPSKYHLTFKIRSPLRLACTYLHARKVLQLLKSMLSNIVKKYIRDPVKTYFGRLKIQVKF